MYPYHQRADQNGSPLAAMRVGDLKHLQMADLRAESAAQIVALCGRCHHTSGGTRREPHPVEH